MARPRSDPAMSPEPPAKELRIALVEDQARTRAGLVALLAREPGFKVVAAWGSMEEALRELERAAPHVLLSDIGLPGMSGIDGVRRVILAMPGLPVLMLTVYSDNDRVFDALCAGASGYVLKDTPPDKLVAAIRELAEGGAPMTPEIARKVVTMFQKVAPPRASDHALTARELDVLQALADGHSYKTAGGALDLALDTVRFHVRSIYAKLHVHSKSEAVLAALRKGIVR
jgi:DNA-binding NarL/FixJ family response regulator